MTNKQILLAYKIFFPVLVFCALGTQFWHVVRINFSVANFFSFFTIQSNIFAATVMLASAYYLYKNKKSHTLDMLRGAAALYMVTTGIVYSLFLLNVDVQIAFPWVNAVVHFIFPLIAFADWLIDKPSQKIPIRAALLWLSYPLAYIAYTLVRGSIINWYPYPFLNVSQHGYLQVSVSSFVIGVFMVLLAGVIAKLPRFTSN